MGRSHLVVEKGVIFLEGGRGIFWDIHLLKRGRGYSKREGYILGGSHIVVEKGGYIQGGRGIFLEGRTYYTFVERGIFWEGGVDSGRVAYCC